MDDGEPCPIKIFEDLGIAYGMGLIGGGVWHSIAGYRNNIRGNRWNGIKSRIATRAPQLALSFGRWGGGFQFVECMLMFYTEEASPWHSIAAGALTGGILQMSQGFRPALISAAFGGLILGMIEGLQYYLQEFGQQDYTSVNPYGGPVQGNTPNPFEIEEEED